MLSANNSGGERLWKSLQKRYELEAPSLGTERLTPKNLLPTYEYDPKLGMFVIRKKVGQINLVPEYRMSVTEFQRYSLEKAKADRWRGYVQKVAPLQTPNLPQGAASLLQKQDNPFADLLGTGIISITPQGSAEMIMKMNTSRIDNPNISESARKTSTFDFAQKIQMSVTGTIADRINMSIRYDSESVFDFENEIKLDYTGKEDEIIKKIEVGNVSFPLSGTLINGGQNLFGVKSEMQFGRLSVTTLFSKQNGETSVTTMQGGALTAKYEIAADQYEENKHFFLSAYFRDRFEQAMQNLPVITSDITIDRIEVWVTNKTNQFTDARNILAANDLAEPTPYIYNRVPAFAGQPSVVTPSNGANGMYQALLNSYNIREVNQITSSLQPLVALQFRQGQDYEKVENARRLTEQEYTLHRSLGFISLKSPLNADEVLAVAFEYTVNGQTFQVGELSTSGIANPQTLLVKLLKGTNLSPQLPTWRLMMKNIYNLGTYPINRDKFQLHVLYQDPKSGNSINYLPEEDLQNELLIRMMRLDRLNQNNDPSPDGVFDYVEGGTILSESGLMIFPVLEPFGSNLRNALQAKGVSETIIRKYLFQELYDSTLTRARQMAEKNRFKIGGTYSSTPGSAVQLNASQMSRGSVKVIAGGQLLTENSDYTVDYATGKVTVLNQGILDSGVPVQIISEDNTLYNVQTKTLIGTHLEYKVSDKFRLGATVMNLTEKPITQKVTLGEEAISNTIWGLSADYSTDLPSLTRLINRLPFRKTDAMSSISLFAEMAQLLPGDAGSIQKKGTSYIDDFEASETSINLLAQNLWKLSSVPEGQPFLPEGVLTQTTETGKNRSLLSWYVIDPLFVNPNYFSGSTPSHIRNNPDTRSSHFVRQIEEQNIFKNKENPNGVPATMPVLNVAFYPTERGPYNFDAVNVQQNGFLSRPETRWGGMMRALPVSDFESSNIEFIEFWVMDPFVEDEEGNMKGGDLYLNLGDVSEDVLKDSRKFFENGMMAGALDSTVWGRVPATQSLVNAFTGDMEQRRLEDIGLDGLSSDDEISFFSEFLSQASAKISGEPFSLLQRDPASDNFGFYRGAQLDQEERGILERYKYYTLPEGNSSSINAYATSLPDNEDLNGDNTLNENENFFQYRISIRPGDMQQVGDNFITDIVWDQTKFPNGDTSSVRWYQFRIPLSRFERTVGSIRDFRSIRFLRLFLHGFSHPVVLRFAKMELVRSEWRKYTRNLRSPGETTTSPELTDGSIDISSVNIEENAGKQPVGYRLPPGIERTMDRTSRQQQQQNEQSMVLRVTDLANGDARAAYKNVLYDLRRYRRMQMEVHAEQMVGKPLYDKELTLFVRMGTDFRNNYYEYEIPLSLTPWGSTDREVIWPAENRLDLDLRLLTDIKQARNEAMRRAGSGVSLSAPFRMESEGRNLYVMGNPNLGEIRALMIGIRYPSDPYKAGESRSAEIWVNELRMSDFENNSGWAANARMNLTLADLGTFHMMAEKSTPGFGAINEKVNERSKNDFFAYNMSTNMELGKLLPVRANLEIPLYASYGESFTNPEYDPIDPDIRLKDKLSRAGSKAEKDSIKHFSQDYQKRKSFTLTQVRYLPKKEGEARLYDPSNLSASYSFNESYARNPNTEYNRQTQTGGGLTYNFAGNAKPYYPFEESTTLNQGIFTLLKDFNINYIPTNLLFKTDYSRIRSEIKYRDINNPHNLMLPIESEMYTNTRFYQWAHDVTKGLHIDFAATNLERLDDTEVFLQDYMKTSYELFKDEVNRSVKRTTNTTQYFHDLRLNYSLPVQKIPLLDWTSLSLSYVASYGWDVGPLMPAETSIGNTIKNSQSIQWTGEASLVSLYNKIPILQKLNQGEGTTSVAKKAASFTKERVRFKAGQNLPVSHQLGTTTPKVTVLDGAGQKVDSITVRIVNGNRIVLVSKRDISNARIEVTGQDGKTTEAPIARGAAAGLRLLTMLKSVSLTLSETNGINLPGYMPVTRILGMDGSAPGFGFVFGAQDKNFAAKAAEKGWLTKSQAQNMPFVMAHNENFAIRATLEPIKGLQVILSGNRAYSNNLRQYYTANANGDFPDSTRNTRESGNFSMTFVAIGNSFEKFSKSNGYGSATYEKFKAYRSQIAARLAAQRQAANPNYRPDIHPVTGEPLTDGSKNGYGLNSQDVLIPAFLAAYGGVSPQKISLDRFPSVKRIRPNWTIRFDGLMALDFFKEHFKSFIISHSYKATYTLGNYQTNIAYDDMWSVLREARDLRYNFIPRYDVSGITLTEQIGPLGSIDITWKNNLSTRISYTTGRTLNLSFSNYQMTEARTQELSLGAGYRIDGAKLFVRSGGDSQKKVENNLNLNADFSIRNNRQLIRRLDEEVPQPSSGQKIASLKLSADLQINQSLSVMAFYDRIVNTPFVSTSFATTNANIGVSVRFTLIQ